VHHDDKSKGYRKCETPCNKEVICETMDGSQREVEMAVKAANTAFPKWAALTGHERAKHMYSYVLQCDAMPRVVYVVVLFVVELFVVQL
jgi:aldehyde dehydrogenase (NAD+)